MITLKARQKNSWERNKHWIMAMTDYPLQYLRSTEHWSPLHVDEHVTGKRQYTLQVHDHGRFWLEKQKYPAKFKVNTEANLRVFAGNLISGAKTNVFFSNLAAKANQGIKESDLISLYPGKKKENKEVIFPVKIKPENKNGPWIIETDKYVGFHIVDIDKENRICIDIRPRFGTSLLIRMLARAFQSINLKELSIRTAEDMSGEMLMLVLIWLHTFNRAIKNGLPKIYEERQNDLPALKGKLQIQSHLKNHFTGRNMHLLPCRYRELTFNNIINRTIRCCYAIVRRHLHYYAPDQLSELNRMDKLLASYGVPRPKRIDPADLERIRYTSIAREYEPLMRYSKALLKSTPENFGGNQKEGYGFLFDITELWEVYLREVLADHYKKKGLYFATANLDKSLNTKSTGEDASLNGNESRRLVSFKDGGMFNLYPDILVKRSLDPSNQNTPVALLDAKYKRIHDNPGANYGIDSTDMYQLTTYLARYSYPNTSENRLNGMALMYPWEVALAYCDTAPEGERWHNQNRWIADEVSNNDKESNDKESNDKGWFIPVMGQGNEWQCRMMGFTLPIFFDCCHNHELGEYEFYPHYVLCHESRQRVVHHYWKIPQKHVDKHFLAKLIRDNEVEIEEVKDEYRSLHVLLQDKLPDVKRKNMSLEYKVRNLHALVPKDNHELLKHLASYYYFVRCKEITENKITVCSCEMDTNQQSCSDMLAVVSGPERIFTHLYNICDESEGKRNPRRFEDSWNTKDIDIIKPHRFADQDAAKEAETAFSKKFKPLFLPVDQQ